MEFYLQKAKLFALETAKKSQEIANQAAKLSQDLATETAKRSKELAIDVTKKADQLKAYAGELTPNISVKGPSTPVLPSEEELEQYGITPELREFVTGLTIKTFRDFPMDSADGEFGTEVGTQQNGDQSGKQDLTPWRERHAVLVLLTVREISDFRYVLCPRRMNESRFWRIYFTLVNHQIAEYEARAMVKATAIAADEERKQLAQEEQLALEHSTRDLGASSAHLRRDGSETKRRSKLVDAAAYKEDQDLDAFLLGALDSSDEGADGDDDDGFDADFDELVNCAVESDGEDEASRSDSGSESKKLKQSVPSLAAKPLAASEVSSDGELVEIPDSESEQASRMSAARNDT